MLHYGTQRHEFRRSHGGTLLADHLPGGAVNTIEELTDILPLDLRNSKKSVSTRKEGKKSWVKYMRHSYMAQDTDWARHNTLTWQLC